MNQIKQNNSLLEKIRNIPNGYKQIITATSLALMLSLSSCGEKKEQEIIKKLDDFEWVNIKKEDGKSWEIYKYTIKKGDYPLLVARNFNNLDKKNGDVFIETGNRNILNNNQNEIKSNQKFQIGEIVYIKVQKYKEKESDYIYKFNKPENYKNQLENEKGGGIITVKKEIIVDGKKETVTIKKDAGLSFYVVEKSDFFPNSMIVNGTKINNCIDFDKIASKISQIDEFSYLKDSIYQRMNIIGKNKAEIKNERILGFNINLIDVSKFSDFEIKNGKVLLPIPTSKAERLINIKDFAYYSQEAIDEIKEHPYYGSFVKELFAHTTKEKFLESLLAFACSESSSNQENNIGEYELHRREGAHNVFSFSHFHILMKKGSPGYKARINLGMSEGETYHPKNATKLFIAFRIEKVSERGEKLSNYFPLDDSMYNKVSMIYNGGDYKKYDYHNKLKFNHDKAKNFINNNKKKT